MRRRLGGSATTSPHSQKASMIQDEVGLLLKRTLALWWYQVESLRLQLKIHAVCGRSQSVFQSSSAGVFRHQWHVQQLHLPTGFWRCLCLFSSFPTPVFRAVDFSQPASLPTALTLGSACEKHLSPCVASSLLQPLTRHLLLVSSSKGLQVPCYSEPQRTTLSRWVFLSLPMCR